MSNQSDTPLDDLSLFDGTVIISNGLVDPHCVQPAYRRDRWFAFESYYPDEPDGLRRFRGLFGKVPSLMIGDHSRLVKTGEDCAQRIAPTDLWETQDDLTWSEFYAFDPLSGFVMFKEGPHRLVVNDAGGIGSYLLGQSPCQMLADWSNGDEVDAYNVLLGNETGMTV